MTQRSKSRKPVTKSKDKKKQKLFHIERELLDCCKNRKPVLLYGQELSADEHKGLINIVRNIYVGVYVKNKEYYNWKYIDCGDKNGEDVYKKLVGHEKRNGILFTCDGLIFVDNLHCNHRNYKDDENYRKLEKIIREHNDKSERVRGGIHKYENGKHLALSVTSFYPRRAVAPLVPTIFKWLVAYTDNDLKEFPKRFLNQFKLILLAKVKKAKAKEEVTFNDIKLKVDVNWKGSYSKSDYKFFVKHKKFSDYEELELDDRFKPVLYRLVKGVMKAKSPTDYVLNKELKKSFHPRNDIDDAKKEITKAFVKLIATRANNIIKIEWAKGKQLMIPRKNITLDEKGNPPF